jgi:ABC-type sugar transport system substrate-binding protein
MTRLRILLSLITANNDYQREQAAVAQQTAQRLDIDLRVIFAESDSVLQAKQILEALQAPVEERPSAVVVEPAGAPMTQIARRAVQHDVGWVVLNRVVDAYDDLRRRGDAPVGAVVLDNVEVGRLQGGQFAALLPEGGKVLYLEGPATELSRQRHAGVVETLPSSIELQSARGRWTEESGAQAVSQRLALASTRVPDLVGSQNDAMAMGVRRAVEALPPGPTRERWLAIPYTGVDGVPSTGLAWVKQGQLTATIISPPLAGLALELVAKARSGVQAMPEVTSVRPVAYPPVSELRPIAGRR